MAIISNINGKLTVSDQGQVSFNRIGTSTTTGYTFPALDGNPNQILKTNGDGILTFVDDENDGTVTGSGTVNKVARWETGGTAIGNGPVTFVGAISSFEGLVNISAGTVDATGFASNQLLRLQNTSTVDGSRMTLGFQGNSTIGSMLAMMEGVNYDQSLGSTDIRFSTYSGSAWNDDMVTFQHTGRVGIGTTSPDSVLHLKKASGDANLHIQAVAAGDPNIKFTSANNRTGDLYYTDATTLARFSYDHADIAFKMYAHNNSSVDFYVSETKAYFPQNVGIGETSPDQKLNVREDGGSDTFRGIEVHNNSIANARAGICFKAYDWVQSAIWHGRGTSAAYNGALVLGTNPNTSDLTVGGVTGRMWILNNGNVGIGATLPVTRLEVDSSQANSTIKTGGLEMQSYAVNNSWYAENLYYNNGWKLRSAGSATQMYMEAGVISFKRAAAGSAGASAVSYTHLTLPTIYSV